MPTHTSHPHTQCKDTQQWTPYTHSHYPYIFSTPRVQVLIPQRGTQTQEVVPFLLGWRQVDYTPAQTSASTARTQTTPAQTLTLRFDPSPQQPLSPSREASAWSN
ncbi:hypothetical protein ILYODFUR_039208 [Ilyodon furcidens]|uniref:Uncharacterized protein n=1 Tax=Ilyodon furcidens TaxID=33524 RepID=A0ABV0T6N7_9TELE